MANKKAGRLRFVSQGKLDPKPIEGLPQVTVHGQGGLHDVVLHPEFSKNSLVYLAYAARGSDGVGTELARGRLVGHRLENVAGALPAEPQGLARPALRRAHRVRPRRATSTSRWATAARWRARSGPTTTPAR